MSYLNDDTPPAPGMVKTIGANGKVEWKRYKQYTKDDIMAAIEEVRSGMSALQASRKYGVPSRTLYDKVKKMGILTANMQKQLQQKKATEGKDEPGASFPPISLLGLQLPNPRNGDPGVGAGGGAGQLDSAAMMLSMLEKMKAMRQPTNLAGLPQNLQAMLEGGNSNGSTESSEKSKESSESEEIQIKEELKVEETSDIRAQFFADLKRLNDGTAEVEGGPAAAVASLELSRSLADKPSHSVTLKARDNNDEDSLPLRKRKISHEMINESNSPKKQHSQDDESSVKLQTTSY